MSDLLRNAIVQTYRTKGIVAMETVNISELRANLLNYLKKASEGQEIRVTSHGEILATIVPPADKFKRARSKLSDLAKTAVIHDVVTPTAEQWDAIS